MDCTDSDNYDMDETSSGGDATAQPSKSARQSRPAKANEAPAPALAPQLLLGAGNTAAMNATPSGDSRKPKASSGKTSRAAEPTDKEAAAGEDKPGIVFHGKAVIDRFEGRWAVLLLGDDERPVSVARKSLPKRVKAGQWLNVQLGGQQGEEVVSAQVDPEETARMRKRIADKLALLRSGAYLKEGADDKPPQS
jgi:hypothetical protein